MFAGCCSTPTGARSGRTSAGPTSTVATSGFSLSESKQLCLLITQIIINLSFRKPHVQWPNGLTIDHLANRVYWVDAQRDQIASCDLDGTPDSFKVVLKRVNQLVHPFAVAIHKDMMYWDDWNNKAIFMADKNNGNRITKVRTELTRF